MADSENRTFEEDCGTAGAVSLIIQVSLPVILLNRILYSTRLILKGGTDVMASPPIGIEGVHSFEYIESCHGIVCIRSYAIRIASIASIDGS